MGADFTRVNFRDYGRAAAAFSGVISQQRQRVSRGVLSAALLLLAAAACHAAAAPANRLSWSSRHRSTGGQRSDGQLSVVSQPVRGQAQVLNPDGPSWPNQQPEVLNMGGS